MTDVGTLDDSTLTKFSHARPGDTGWNTGGLRDFFMYRDLGVAAATHGRVLAQLVRANLAPPSTGTGWHRHDAEFHIVIMLKGWARGMGKCFRLVAEQQGDIAGFGLLLQQAQAQTGALDRVGVLPALQRVPRPWAFSPRA